MVLFDGSRAMEHDYTKKNISGCRGRFLFQKHFSICVNTQPPDDRRYPYILTVFEQMFYGYLVFTQEIFSIISLSVYLALDLTVTYLLNNRQETLFFMSFVYFFYICY